MNILMVASEAAPYVRTGDVANVVTGLAVELLRKGHDVRLAIPHYKGLAFDREPVCIIPSLDVSLASYSRPATITRFDRKIDSVQLPAYLVGNLFYFGRDNPYGYLDDYERFVFFSRAILAMLCHPGFVQEGWQPDVIQGHDWVTGLMPMWLRQAGVQGQDAYSPAFAFTLHNTGYQGRFGYRALLVAGLADQGIYTAIGENAENINFMARGIMAADVINTVSPQHAKEIRSGSFAPELLKAVQVRGAPLRGILNGLNFRDYNPALDERLYRRFDQYSVELRQENKIDLQKECGLDIDPKTPLLGVVSRLIAEKGIGLIAEAMPTLLAQGVQLVIAGEADDQHYREVFRTLAADYPRQVKPFFASDDTQIRRICASSDIILVPSLHEPCGLQQLVAMHYGAVPVVHKTGGLADTVLPWDADDVKAGQAYASGKPFAGRGFVFEMFDAPNLLKSVFGALDLYRTQTATWQELQRYNMRVDFSWERSAAEYIELYKEAIESRSVRPPLAKGEAASPDTRDRLLGIILEIDELAMSTGLLDYLQQAARGVRGLLESDAVLIWLKDPVVPLRLQPVVLSSAAGGGMEKLKANTPPLHDLPQQFSRSTQYTYYLGAEGAPGQARLGFLGSKLAQAEGWQAQLSAPMSTQGSIQGQIDVFSCEQGRQFTDQEVSALIALARTLAANLEKAWLHEQRDRLLATDRELAQAARLSEMARVILSCARDLTGAIAARLALNGDIVETLDESGNFAVGAIARADSGSALCRMLVSSRGQEIGWIEVVKPMPGSFSREDEIALGDLAAQAADALDAAQDRGARGQVRVDRLRKLAASVLGGGDFDELLDHIVAATADALDVEAASLYLINEETSRLVAVGRHTALLQAGASYDMGEGITGWIAEAGETIKADSSTELRAMAHWRGEYIALLSDSRARDLPGHSPQGH